MSKNDDLWFEEIHPENVGLKFKVKRKVFSEVNPLQKVEIFETESHGMLLAHDGMVMITERDEFIYHDMIAHTPLFVHPEPKNVLVIGGGDGGTVREVLRHPSVEKCTMVEIDGRVVDVCKEFIPQTSHKLEDLRVQLIIGDGVDFVKNSKEKFDVIIVDSSDPIGPATPLFNVDFYKDVSKCLNPKGIVVSQAESPYYELPMQKKLVEILAGVFKKVHLSNYTNLSYPGGCWTFSWASNEICPFKDFDGNKVKNSGLEFQYYNENIHWGSFCLPQFVLDAHGANLTPLPTFTLS